jgi:hypothetical protein
MWYRLPVDVCNNTRANDTTPPQCVEERIYFDFPEEFSGWAVANSPDLVPPNAEGFIREGSQFSPVAIVNPRFPDQVGGVVEITGNTDVDDMSFFQIGFGEGNEPASFIQIGENGLQAGFAQQLGIWNTGDLNDGVYTLQLQVVSQDNRIESVSTRVTVDNTPPEVRLVEPQEGSTYYANTDVVVTIETEVFDAGDIDRVEFFIDSTTQEPEGGDLTALTSDGVKIGESTAFPYSFPWTIEETGLRTFWAVAYDRANNRTESERVVIRLEETAP